MAELREDTRRHQAQTDWIAADFSCGSGYTVLLAQKVKKVHAIDTQKEMLHFLEDEIKLLIVNFKKQETCFGPPARLRATKEKAISLPERDNFTLLDTKDLPHGYLLAFVKP